MKRWAYFTVIILLFPLSEPQGDLSGVVSGSKAHETVCVCVCGGVP